MTMKQACRVAATALALIAWAGQLQAQKVGTTSLQFLKVMPTARATAMGDAYASLSGGADAVFWNPAGLVTTENHEVTTTLTMWLIDTKQIALAYGLPMGDWGTLGFQVQYIDYETMQETRAEFVELVVPPNGEPFFNSGLTGRSFTPYAFVVGVSYARAFTDKFSAAVTAKYVRESLWSDQTITIVNNETGESTTYKTYAGVLLFDFGMLYDTGFRSVTLGVSVQNFGSQVTFADVAHPAPLAFRLGVSSNLFGREGLLFQDDQNRLTLAYDLFQPNDYHQQMHLGAEYSFSEWVALRAGYKFEYDSEGATFGAGVRADVADWLVRMDYSYGQMSEYLNDVHRISLGVQFR